MTQIVVNNGHDIVCWYDDETHTDLNEVMKDLDANHYSVKKVYYTNEDGTHRFVIIVD